jgi:hypothetical protein
MLEKAKEKGVPIDPMAISTLKAGTHPDFTMDATAPLGENFDPIKNKPRTVYPNDKFHSSAKGEELILLEPRTFKVHASELYSWTGLQLVKGGKYIFEVPPGQGWKDASIDCGPEGWNVEEEDFSFFKSRIIKLSEGRRRHNQANWFEVIGTVGKDEDYMFRIGDGSKSVKPFTSPHSGGLYAFANDLESMYGNNSGFVEITVKRIE